MTGIPLFAFTFKILKVKRSSLSLYKKIKIVCFAYITFFTLQQLHLHLADAFIQSDLQLHSGYTFSLVRVFPGNRTHNILRC